VNGLLTVCEDFVNSAAGVGQRIGWRHQHGRPTNIASCRADLDFERGLEMAHMSAVMNAALRLNNSNKLVIRNTFTRNSETEARRFVGLNGGIDSTI
jgi:hypothetical protein